jgi:asparagine synthase (glutamine-hydrolysing)
MCGICGVVDFDPGFVPSINVIERMADCMKHRGPDDYGYHTGPHVGLGHRRLSIIDLAGGHQPIYSDDGKKVIVFNGEIYNYREIRCNLESSGARFNSNSDTEVLLKCYEKYGTDCLDHLRGMFAFAIWDSDRQALFIARDRLGKKPLYYRASENGLVFGSEIRSILAYGGLERQPDLEAIDSFLSLGYTLSPRTALKNIYKLPAGCFLVFTHSGPSVLRYWQLHTFDAQPRFESADAIAVLKETLDEAVSLRMISDVPLGAYLSGGLDSSIIVGIMSEHSQQPVKTFTIGYENAPEHSELKYAAIVAKHFKTDHREIILKPQGFFDLITKMVWHLEEPIGDQACIPLFLISEQAKKEVTVMLSGEGADELFAGYNIYVMMRLIGQYRRLPGLFRHGMVNPVIRKILDGRRAEKYIEWSEKELQSRYLGDMADLSSSLKKELYAKDFLDCIEGSYMKEIEGIYDEVRDSDDLAQMLYLDTKTWLVEDLLLKADKMTMAASIELRTPFLDHRLAEFSRRLLSDLKINRFQKKYILKEAYKEMLPKEITNRKKKGFPVPLSLWFKDNLNDLIADVLLSDRARGRGYFNTDFVRHMLKQQTTGAIDYSKTLWNLLVLELWHQAFIDSSPV